VLKELEITPLLDFIAENTAKVQTLLHSMELKQQADDLFKKIIFENKNENELLDKCIEL